MIGKVLVLCWDRFVGIALPSPFSQNCAFSTKLCQLHFGSKREPLGLFARWAHQRNNLRRIWLNLRLENLQLSRGKWLLAGLIRSQCATRVFSGNTFCKIDKYTQEYLKKKLNPCVMDVHLFLYYLFHQLPPNVWTENWRYIFCFKPQAAAASSRD